jgi:ubiquinone/menaquinone biosynthesis C-methylase UbiE
MVEISRINRTKAQAKAWYDRLGPWYDILAGNSERKFKKAGLQLLEITEGEKILEIGFGTGEGIVELAQLVGKTGKIYGIDISERMYGITMQKVAKAGFPDRIDLRCSDAGQLPYHPNSFDAVFTSFTLELFDTPEIPKVLSECVRVMKNNGRLCVVAMSKTGSPGLMLNLYEWAHEVFPQYVDCRPIFVEKALRDASFAIKSSETMSMWGLPVEIVLAIKAGQ